MVLLSVVADVSVVITTVVMLSVGLNVSVGEDLFINSVDNNVVSDDIVCIVLSAIEL